MLVTGLYYIWCVSWVFGSPMWLYKWKFSNWHQSPLSGPIMLEISLNNHKFLCGCGWVDVGQWLHLGMHGCGNMGGLESLGGIKCTKSTQNWTKYTSSAPSQQKCPHPMNGSAPEIMGVHMWLVDWFGVPMWVVEPQFDMAYVQLSTPSPPHSVLKIKRK